MNPIKCLRRLSLRVGAQLAEIGHGESGQSLVIVAFSMVALIGMLGLVIDIGLGYVRYRQMQTAADIAALAGTRELALGNGEAVAIQRIEQILTSNGADISTSRIDFSGDEVSVRAGLNIQTVFTPIFGLDQISVSADADATFGQTAEASNVLPFAVEESLWQLDTPVNIWTGETGAGGNYGWVRWGGQSLSTSILRANIEDPSNSGTLRIGSAVPGKPGVSFSAVRASLQSQIGRTIDVFFYNSEEVSGSGANLRYTITGFGKFRITEIESRGVNSAIRGYFEQSVVLGGEIVPGVTRGNLATGLIQ